MEQKITKNELIDEIYSYDKYSAFKKGLCVEKFLRKNVKLGEKSNFDIIGHEKNVENNLYDYYISIYEIKETEIGFDDFVNCIKKVVDFIHNSKNYRYVFRIVLIGSKYKNEDEYYFRHINDLFKYIMSSRGDSSIIIGVDLYTYSFVDGILHFDENYRYMIDKLHRNKKQNH